MDLVDRARKIIVQPREEWRVIAAEPQSVQRLFTEYVMILAAIPALASFIGFILLGAPPARAVVHLVLGYVLSLGSVYLFAVLIDALAPGFGGEKNFLQALKVAAFAPTASWLAGIFGILPLLSILKLLGLYSLYLLFLGLPPLMKVPEDKAIPYTVVIIIAGLVLAVVIGALSALAIPTPMRGF